MKHSLVRQDQLFTLFLVSKKRASNKNETVIDVQPVYEINHIRTAEMKSNEEWSSRCEHNLCNCVSCLKKIQDFNGVWTRDLAIPVRCSNQLSYEATDVGSCSIMSSYVPVKEVNVIAVQSNLDYPDIDYPDFLIIRTFSLVPIWSWTFISHDQDP